jgi:hypothetical protein
VKLAASMMLPNEALKDIRISGDAKVQSKGPLMRRGEFVEEMTRLGCAPDVGLGVLQTKSADIQDCQLLAGACCDCAATHRPATFESKIVVQGSDCFHRRIL